MMHPGLCKVVGILGSPAPSPLPEREGGYWDVRELLRGCTPTELALMGVERNRPVVTPAVSTQTA